MNVLLAGLAAFIFIFLKAFQQRNVVLDSPPWIVVLTSLAMAVVEVYVIAVVVTKGYDPALVAAVGIGGGLGCVLSMRTHRLLFGRV